MDVDELPAGLRERLEELERRFEDDFADLSTVRSIFAEPDAYAREVFPTEIERLRRVSAPRRPSDVDLLVLLCGTSPQPLMLSAGFVQPRRVMLVGSESKTGRESLESVQGQLRELERDGLAIEWEATAWIDKSEPVAAYRELARAIREASRRRSDFEGVLVDITGGTKTMVAAAFLVCSELGLRSAYVDTEYDGRARLPRPGTSEFQLLGDPIQAFRVRDLQQVVKLTNRSMYRAAAELLDEIARVDVGISQVDLQSDRTKLDQLCAWSERRIEALVDAPEPLASFANEWSKHSRKAGWSLEDCALVGDDGRLLSRFVLHRVVHARRLYDRDRGHDAFLVSFAACDALADGLVSLLIASKRVKREKVSSYEDLKKKIGGQAVAALVCGEPLDADKKVVVDRWRGVPRQVFDAALGYDTTRKARDALMHGIGVADERVIATYFDANAPGRLLEAVEHALGREDFDFAAEAARVEQAVASLESLAIGEHLGSTA